VQRCAHSWRFDGRDGCTDDVRAATGCEDPYRIGCTFCELRRWVRCGGTRASRCEPCARVYRGRVGRVAGSGLLVARLGAFVTLTAPGSRPHRLPSGAVCRCTPPGGVDLARWNADAGPRFNRFMRDLRRLLDDDGLQYFRAVEVQRRGALHYHLLLRRDDGAPTVIPLRALRELALKHGFGHSVDAQPVQSGHAAYVAKYVGKAADSRRDVPWRGSRWVVKRGFVDPLTGEILPDERRRVPSWSPTYRTWTASRRWGRSMAEVRAAQAHHVLVLAALPSWATVPARRAWSALGGLPAHGDLAAVGAAGP
jgi:hypothetical protein